MRLMRIVIT